jgi:hypothetical protein
MNTVYLPFIGKAPPATPHPMATAMAGDWPAGFGVDVRAQDSTPAALVRNLLNPPCWHNWTSTGGDVGHNPMLWNPDHALAWSDILLLRQRPRQLWLLGNEPLANGHRPETTAAWVREFAARSNGAPFALLGGSVRDEDLAYQHAVMRQCPAPAAMHFHLYPLDTANWRRQITTALRASGNYPVLVTETCCTTWTADAQRTHMDGCVETLRQYPQVRAIYWYVSHSAVDRAECWLLTTGDASAGLTATGRHYRSIVANS